MSKSEWIVAVILAGLILLGAYTVWIASGESRESHGRVSSEPSEVVFVSTMPDGVKITVKTGLKENEND